MFRKVLAAVLLPLLTALVCQAEIIDSFDSPTLSGSWVVDRYAPATFQPGVTAHGRTGVLEHGISSAYSPLNRPAGFGGAFYNTQGRKHELPLGTTSIFVDLYIPSDWNTDQRMAGLWATGLNDANAIVWYPILEYGIGQDFRVWNDVAGWEDLDSPANFNAGAWSTLGIELIGTDFVYTINGDLVHTTSAGGSTRLGDIFLQGYNASEGINYSIFWDNLQTDFSTVPEPASIVVWGAMSLLAAIGWRRLR